MAAPDQLRDRSTHTGTQALSTITSVFDATVPAALTPDIAGAVGAAATAARRDHVHNVPAAAPTTTLSSITTNAEGTGASFARNDHTHAITFFDATVPVSLTPDIVGAVGTAATAARRDHVHNVPAATAVALTDASTSTEGTSSSFARADHTHAITGFLPLTGGTLTGMLNLPNVGGTHAIATSTIGDKIAIYGPTLASRYGFGLQAGALVAYMDAGAALSIRRAATTGAASVGSLTGVNIYEAGRIRTADASGTQGIPNYSFITDSDTGMYNAGLGHLGFTVGGTHRLGITTTAITSTLPVLVPDGSQSAPSLAFSADPDTGFSRGAGTIVGSVQGTKKMEVTSAGVSSPTFIIDDLVYFLNLNTWHQNVDAAWTAYTPSTVGVTLGTGGSIGGRYKVIGSTCFVDIIVTYGTGAAYSGIPRFYLPITAYSTIGVGSAAILDASSRWYTCTAIMDGNDRVVISYDGGSLVGGTLPFSLASGDKVTISMAYELVST